MEYSTDDGTETASVIAERIIEEVPFFMIVQREELVVISACTDCETSPRTTYTQAVTSKETAARSSFPLGGFGVGIFVAGFLAAVLIIVIILLIIA